MIDVGYKPPRGARKLSTKKNERLIQAGDKIVALDASAGHDDRPFLYAMGALLLLCMVVAMVLS